MSRDTVSFILVQFGVWFMVYPIFGLPIAFLIGLANAAQSNYETTTTAFLWVFGLTVLMGIGYFMRKKGDKIAA